MPPKNKFSNGSGSVSIEKVFNLLEQYESKNALAFNDVKIEVQRCRTELLEKISDMKERLVKMEAQPAHEQFQKTFCPNTRGIELMVKWIEKHEKWHDETKEENKKRQEEYIEALERKIDERNKEIRAFFLTALSAAAVGIINVMLQFMIG